MGYLKLHDLILSRDSIAEEREQVYLKLSPAERFFKTIQLLKLSIAMNGGKPIKYPQAKGIVIKRPIA